MDNTPEVVAALEDLLVGEFRTCQMLLVLTRDERQALARSDARSLSTLVEEKEALLDELGRIEEQRRVLTQELAQKLGLTSPSPSIAEISTALQSDEAKRINRLREGILALSSEVHELTSGNRALAVSALERVDAVQTFLVDFFRPALFYQPPGVPPLRETGPAWGVDVGT